jgi:ABC-type sulfate/molybdate transport systems ATPase subunit
MSRGERSRLAVARALASEAAVLVMDEPLAHVDPARLGRYWDVLRTHCASRGVSLVFATHAPDVALAEADHVVCLHDGRVTHAGSIATLYHDPPSAEVAAFLGPANWFESHEAAAWLDNARPGRRCYRPEQIRIRPRPEGRLVVHAARFCGSYEMVDVTDSAGDAASRLYHRPAGSRLSPGDRVAIEVIDGS